MRTRIVFLVIIILTSINLMASSAEWIKILSHTHTNNSDGKDTPQTLMQKAANDGYDALIVTDHFDSLVERNISFSEYTQLFADPPLTKKGRSLLVVIGAEITSFCSKGKIHILTFPIDRFDSEINLKPADEVLAKLMAQDVIRIAAHPGQPSYQYDGPSIAQVIGVELFNDIPGSGGVYLPTLALVNVFCGRKIPLTLEAGADIHGWAYEKVDREKRATFAEVESYTVAAVVEAFKEHRTYVSQYGAWLENYSLIDKKISFDLCFEKNILEAKTVFINRDGKNIATKIFPLGKKRYHYEWEDNNAAVGAHLYYVHIGGCLITSPTKIEIIAPPVQTPAVTRFTGGVPILLGKTPAEVDRIFAKKYHSYRLDHSNGFYFIIYHDFPAKGCECYVNFSPYRCGSEVSTNQQKNMVHWVGMSVDSFYQFVPSQIKYFKPEEIVPKEILRLTPSSICFFSAERRRCLLILWYINNQTFCLIVEDTKRNLFDVTYQEIEGKGKVAFFHLNQNGYDFRHCDRVTNFAYMDCVPANLRYHSSFVNADFGNIVIGMVNYCFRYFDN